MPENKQLRAGLVGCGYQGQWLARAALALDDFQLVAGTDPDKEAIKELLEITAQAQIEPSAESLISRSDLDVVFVATPHHLLQPFAMQAVRAGKHVLAEKPIGLNAQEALELESAVAQNGVTYMSGYSFRYFPPVAEAKRLIDAGLIGEIQTISAGMSWMDVPGGWIADPESGGGILGFFGCHMVDRVLWFLDDDPAEVSASVTFHHEYGVDQTSIFQVRFARGAVAQFNICGSSAGWFDFAHVCGRDGHVYLSLATFPNYALTVTSSVDDKYKTPQTIAMDLERPVAIQQKMEAELSDFAQAVRRKQQPPITVADGRKCLQILDAVFASSKAGESVSLA